MGALTEGHVDEFGSQGTSPPLPLAASSLPLGGASKRLRTLDPDRRRALGLPGAVGRPRTRTTEPAPVTPTVRQENRHSAEAPSSRRDTLRGASVHVAARLLTARETACYLGLTYDTVLDLAKAGTLRPVRVPGANGGPLRKLLFDRLDLDRLIETSKAGA